MIFGILFDFLIGFSVSGFVVGDCCLESFHAHDGAVHFFFREAAEELDDVLVCDFGGFVERHAFDQLDRKSVV